MQSTVNDQSFRMFSFSLFLLKKLRSVTCEPLEMTNMAEQGFKFIYFLLKLKAYINLYGLSTQG